MNADDGADDQALYFQNPDPEILKTLLTLSTFLFTLSRFPFVM